MHKSESQFITKSLKLTFTNDKDAIILTLPNRSGNRYSVKSSVLNNCILYKKMLTIKIQFKGQIVTTLAKLYLNVINVNIINKPSRLRV